MYVHCDSCGKRLVEKTADGKLIFKFGKSNDVDYVPVEIEIFGTMKIKCLRKRCNHITVINNLGE